MKEPRTLCTSHSVAAEALAVMRHKDTPPTDFSRHIHRLSLLLAAEATRHLDQMPITVQTPNAPCGAKILRGRHALVPIVRSGEGMLEAHRLLLPEALVWHVIIARDERTALPLFKDSKVPETIEGIEETFILDPMLATAGSACFAATHLKRRGATKITFVGVIGCTEGVARMQREHPDVDIILGEVDPSLDERKFIVPGLGDAGDRQFPTVTWAGARLADRLHMVI